MRAIARAQEGLPAEKTVEVYERICFPAQRLHFILDAPRDAATGVIENAGVRQGSDPGLPLV